MYLSFCLPIYEFIYLTYIYLSMYISIYLFIYLTIKLTKKVQEETQLHLSLVLMYIPGFAQKPSYPYKSQFTQVRIFKSSQEHSHGSTSKIDTDRSRGLLSYDQTFKQSDRQTVITTLYLQTLINNSYISFFTKTLNCLWAEFYRLLQYVCKLSLT